MAWRVETAEANKGTYLDTTIRDPAQPLLLLRVDVTPGIASPDPLRAARPVEASLQAQPGYRAIDFRRTTFKGFDAVRWEFVVRESGVLLHKVDVFFASRGNGFGVLTQAPASIFQRWSSNFSRMRGSLSSGASPTSSAPPTRTPSPKSPLRAHVVITKIGFSQDTTGGSGSIIDYGLVLANTSPSADARDVTVTVRAVDTQDRSIASNDTTITGIPAGSTFTVSGELLPNVSLAVTKLQPTISVGRSRPKSFRLPVVTGVRLKPGGELFDALGRLTNPYSKPLPEDATIYAIFLNRAGRIVGASQTTTGAQVQPGATVSFDVQAVINNAAVHPDSAHVSVDPCGQLGLAIGDCVFDR